MIWTGDEKKPVPPPPGPLEQMRLLAGRVDLLIQLLAVAISSGDTQETLEDLRQAKQIAHEIPGSIEAIELTIKLAGIR